MADRNYGFLRQAAQFEAFVDRMVAANKPFGFDIESGYVGEARPGLALLTEHPDWRMVGFSFTNSTEWARYVPIAHDAADVNVDDPVRVARALWRLLQTGLGVAHNLSFELKGLSRWFREVLWDDPEVGEAVREEYGLFPYLSDSMIEAFLTGLYNPLDPGKDLKSLTKFIFNHQMTEFKELFPDAKVINRVRFNSLELTPQVVNYACEDSVWCLALHEKHAPMMEGTLNLVYRTEMRLVRIFVEMEQEGVAVDWPLVNAKAEEIKTLTEKYNEQIQNDLSERLGRVVNINLGSTQQLQKILFEPAPEGLGLPVKEKSEKTGKASTSEKALRLVAKADPVINSILTYRTMVKLYGSYLDKYRKELTYLPSLRATPNHNQLGAATGRTSVTDFPYQQWPKPYHYETKDGTTFDLNFRDLAISPPGFRIIGFDYSQVELRVLAGVAQEDSLLKAFADGTDIHKATAASMMGIPLEQVTKKIRSRGKAQPLDAKILTPSGWVRMGDIKVGDLVIGSNGTAVKVEGVHPQGKKSIYKVTTSDGGSTECCDEHLWTTRNGNTKNAPWTTKPLKDLMAAGLRQGLQPKYELPARPVVEYAPAGDLPIDPYFLGLLLGDGGFRHDWAAYYCTADEELAVYVRQAADAMGVGVHEALREDGLRLFYFPSKIKNQPNPLTRALKDLGLWGVHGSEKFIPEIYLRAAPGDRLALLQGIMDTDGTPQASGALLRMTAPEMVRGVQETARSLGGNATYSVKATPDSAGSFGKDRKDTHLTQVLLPAGSVPFRLARKVEKLNARKYKAAQRLLSAEYVGEKEAQCISVSADDGLYITDSLLVTHNTLNFAVVYGSGAANIASMLETPEDPVTVEDAEKLLEQYFSTFSKLRTWMDNKVVEGKSQGYVQTLFGRRYTVWEFKDTRNWIRAKGERLCVNAPIQGGAADYMKIAMVRVADAIKKAEQDGTIGKGTIRLVMMIHDALEFYVHESVPTQVALDLLNPAVSYPIKGLPEIKADWHEGRTWGSVVEIKRGPDGKIVGYGIEDVDQEFASIEEAYAYQDDAKNKNQEKPETVEPVQPEPEQAHRKAVLTLSQMPDENQWFLFAAFLKERKDPDGPGLTLVTPEGSKDLVGVVLTKEDQPKVNALLGGASLTFETDAAEDFSDLMEAL